MHYHVIPDNDAMQHESTLDCACYPRTDDVGVVVHNAKDVREAHERHGRPTENGWCIVQGE